MYNRYIRNDHGTYTRVPEEDGPPVSPSGGGPLHADAPSDEPIWDGGPPQNGVPPRDGGPAQNSGPPQYTKPHRNPPSHAGPGLLRRLLDDARMDRIGDGDLMLLVLLFFLAREGADEELLIALGLLLIL